MATMTSFYVRPPLAAAYAAASAVPDPCIVHLRTFYIFIYVAIAINKNY